MKKTLFSLVILLGLLSCQNQETTEQTEGAPSQESAQQLVLDTTPTLKTPPIFRLDTILDFDSIVSIRVRNNEGEHQLSSEKWEEINYTLQRSIFIYGLLCARQKNALIFTFKDGSELEGYFCSGHINFTSSRIHGSFRMPSVVDFDSL